MPCVVDEMASSSDQPPMEAEETKKKPNEVWYAMNEEKIDEVRKAKAWMQDANYFTRVRFLPSFLPSAARRACERPLCPRFR